MLGGPNSPAGVRITVAPPMVNFALRAVAVFDFSEKLTEPLPLPLAGESIVTNLAGFKTVHRQPAWVVTVSVAVPPAIGKLVLLEIRE